MHSKQVPFVMSQRLLRQFEGHDIEQFSPNFPLSEHPSIKRKKNIMYIRVTNKKMETAFTKNEF